MKKIVSFVNPNFNQGPKEFNAHYLPYSTGILWSYITTFPHLLERYELGEFIWKREEVSEVAERLKNHDIVGFSTYIWNRNYNYSLAKKLKELNPDILIVFGGPEPAIESTDLYQKHPYIDVTVIREGEIIFKNLLEANSREEFFNIRGLVINKNGETVSTGAGERIDNLDDIPSPYLSGLFDNLIEKHKDVRWNVTMETNRGCPYQCTFCDWGSLTYSKVKLFDEKRVCDELEWTGKQGFDFISFTDANFGIFEERDSRIADKLIEVQQKYKNPKSYTMAWAKNQKKSVIQIAKKLIEGGGAKIGLNLSVQSLHEDVLSAIRRKNLAMNKIEEVFDMCEKEGIPLYTELILGLPEETLESWKENFYKLFRANNHTGITVYQAQLLENAEMNLTQRKQYQIESSQIYDYIVGTYNEKEVKESIEVITATRDLPRETMLDAQVFSWFINTFHINGLTSYVSRYLYISQNVDYSEFYEKLLKHIQTNPWFKQEMELIREHYTNWSTMGAIDYPPISNVEIHGWNLIHSTIIKMHFEDKYDMVFNVIGDFLQKEYSLSQNLFEQLMDFQKRYIVDYKSIKNYPMTKDYDYDFIGYVQGIAPLESKTTYEFDFPEDKTVSLERFCEQIFFYRRRNFGKTWITKKN
jgi:putative methyltransferase